MANERLRPLRRTPTPYVGQAVIIGAVGVFCCCVALSKHQWGFLWAAALPCALFALYVLVFGLKYEILWDEKNLVMRASGLKGERRIEFSEINKITCEVAGSGEWLAQSRPFRRIVVHGLRRDAPIDISLRHFRLDDIDVLLSEIRTQRPDLEIPVITVQSRRYI